MPGLIFLYTEYFAQHNSKEDTDATKNGKEKKERKKKQSQKRNHSAVLGNEHQDH